MPLAHWLPDERRDAVYKTLGREEGIGLRLLTPDGLVGLFPASAQPRIIRSGMTIVVVAEA